MYWIQIQIIQTYIYKASHSSRINNIQNVHKKHKQYSIQQKRQCSIDILQISQILQKNWLLISSIKYLLPIWSFDDNIISIDFCDLPINPTLFRVFHPNMGTHKNVHLSCLKSINGQYQLSPIKKHVQIQQFRTHNNQKKQQNLVKIKICPYHLD